MERINEAIMVDEQPVNRGLRKKLPRKQRLLGKRPRHQVAARKCKLAQRVLDRILAKIIEPLALTIVDNDNNKQRRLVEFKDGCHYGKFRKTKAYELIAQRGSGPTRW
jgi:hypothetical protein